MKKTTKVKLAIMGMMVILGTVNAQAGYYDHYGYYHPTCQTVWAYNGLSYAWVTQCG